MTGTARAKHYPQPPPFAALVGPRCEHGEIEGKCALCRVPAEPDQDAPEPASKPRSPRRRTARDRKDELTDVAVQGELFTQGETTVRPSRW